MCQYTACVRTGQLFRRFVTLVTFDQRETQESFRSSLIEKRELNNIWQVSLEYKHHGS